MNLRFLIVKYILQEKTQPNTHLQRPGTGARTRGDKTIVVVEPQLLNGLEQQAVSKITH